MATTPKELARKGLRFRIASDAGALFVVQGLGYLVPLVTLPYLVRVFGKVEFGVYGLAVAFAGYIQILLEYGFWLSGTRRAIPVLGKDVEISRLFWSIHGAKFVLLMLALIPTSLVVYLVPSLRAGAKMIFLLIVAAIGSSLFPVWLLQAREKLKQMAQIALVIKLSNLAVFILVRGPEDLHRLGWFLVVQAWLHGLSGLFVALKGISVHRPHVGWLQDGVRQIGRDFPIFASQLAGLFVANTTTIVLGSTSGPMILGGYLVADRIARAASSLTGPVSQAVLPVSARLFHEARLVEAFSFLSKFFWSVGGLVAIGCAALFWWSPEFVRFVSGGRDPQTIECLRVLSIFPFLVFVNNLLGPQTLLNLNRDKTIFILNLLTGLFALGMQSILIPKHGALGAAVVVVLAEAIMLGSSFFVIAILYTRLWKSGCLDGKWQRKI
jgi:polysaccharide transporter, PST family